MIFNLDRFGQREDIANDFGLRAGVAFRDRLSAWERPDG